jgi:hypothetical protein
MNERIKELAEQAGLPKYITRELCPTVIEKFAELVRQDERTSNSKNINVTDIVLRAKAEEREAIAALVEADGRVHEKAPDAVWAKTVAKLIRARGEPNPAFKNFLDDKWAGIV